MPCDVLANHGVSNELDFRQRIEYIRVPRRRVPGRLCSFEPYASTYPDRMKDLVERLTNLNLPTMKDLRR